ncbi:MAG TPA: hypothetical protein VD736_04075 [Nitrososphaera sp.]|nr:hypothetical protein [Nitrososphaera sp.]
MDADLIEKTKKALRYIEDENKNTRAKLDKARDAEKDQGARMKEQERSIRKVDELL